MNPPMALAGQRFEFGRNWQRFLSVVNDDRIEVAQRAIQAMLSIESLEGRSFLDIGSGSGLSSLAAMRLGAARVHSFDFDPASVACTAELKRRYFPDHVRWSVEQGSALDDRYLEQLGRWDIVYSWGVLHHTGDMTRALDLASMRVAPNGILFIAIYNAQGLRSSLWRAVKRAYNANAPARALILSVGVPYFFLGTLARDLAAGRSALARYRAHARGMSPLHDWIDWLGGYPFEVASRKEIVAFYESRGYALSRLKSCGRKSGCNEFVFTREP